MSITSVLETVQSILGSNPIHNEPAYERLGPGDPTLLAYNHAACYRSIKFTVDIYEMVLTKPDEELPEIIRPFADTLRERAFTALRFFQRKLVHLRKDHPSVFSNPQHIHHPAMRIDYDALSTQILGLTAAVPEDLAKELNSDDVAVRTLEDARKQEEEARRLARLEKASIAVPNGARATRRNNNRMASLNAQIKEMENSIRAIEASGNNARNQKADLAALKRKRNAAAKPNSPKKNTAKNNNSNKGNNNNAEYEYNEE
jgi:hypothetical protein